MSTRLTEDLPPQAFTTFVPSSGSAFVQLAMHEQSPGVVNSYIERLDINWRYILEALEASKDKTLQSPMIYDPQRTKSEFGNLGATLPQVKREFESKITAAFGELHVGSDARMDEDTKAIIHSNTEKFAKLLISVIEHRALKSEVEFEVFAEPDGNIRFSWFLESDEVFEVSVGKDAFIYYAGRIEGQRFSGRFAIKSGLPGNLRESIQHFYTGWSRSLYSLENIAL